MWTNKIKWDEGARESLNTMHMEEITIFSLPDIFLDIFQSPAQMSLPRPSQTNLSSNPGSTIYLLCDIEQMV